YLWKGHNTRVKAIFVIRLLFLAVVFFGTMRSAAFAWALGDIGVGLMAWLNIVAILILCPPALHCLRDYEKQKKNGQDPVFKAKDIGITNTDLWK
ncbi:MAG: sodium:alanine symporter, partial [Opitutales bacterium]|nr:sodium:alanine symporter [Opitutales bacterium]